MSGDARLVLTGSADLTAILWRSVDGKKLQTLLGHAGVVSSVAVSRDGKHLWTASMDGTTRLWDPASGKERCRLYSFDAGKDWLVVTPEGLFDGSPGAGRFVTYRDAASGRLVDDDATRQRFHRPGLLAQVWKSAR
jgi:WD40 repeat protein